jgi:hypothetical protein
MYKVFYSQSYILRIILGHTQFNLYTCSLDNYIFMNILLIVTKILYIINKNTFQIIVFIY